MAYKFQSGAAALSGALAQTGSLQIIDDDGSVMASIARDTGNFDTTGTITCDDSITIDSITITDTELGYLDGLTLGTVAASKVVTADASGDFSGYRNISGSGTLQAVGNAYLGGTLAVSGNQTSAGNIIPDGDSARDLGSNGVRWANIYVDSITGATVALTVESRAGGQTISSATGFALVTAGDGAIVTLPAASAGKELTVKLSSSIGDVILAAGSGDVIEDPTTTQIRLQSTGSAVKLTAYDAQTWFVS